jgi:hypothetical protein
LMPKIINELNKWKFNKEDLAKEIQDSLYFPKITEENKKKNMFWRNIIVWNFKELSSESIVWDLNCRFDEWKEWESIKITWDSSLYKVTIHWWGSKHINNCNIANTVYHWETNMNNCIDWIVWNIHYPSVYHACILNNVKAKWWVIANSAKIEDSELWKWAIIMPKADISSTIIWDNVILSNNKLKSCNVLDNSYLWYNVNEDNKTINWSIHSNINPESTWIEESLKDY